MRLVPQKWRKGGEVTDKKTFRLGIFYLSSLEDVPHLYKHLKCLELVCAFQAVQFFVALVRKLLLELIRIFYCETYEYGHLRVLKKLSFIETCPLLRGNLIKVATFRTKRFVRYSKHVGYLGCPLLGGFTVFYLNQFLLNSFYPINKEQVKNIPNSILLILRTVNFK